MAFKLTDDLNQKIFMFDGIPAGVRSNSILSIGDQGAAGSGRGSVKAPPEGGAEACSEAHTLTATARYLVLKGELREARLALQRAGGRDCTVHSLYRT